MYIEMMTGVDEWLKFEIKPFSDNNSISCFYLEMIAEDTDYTYDHKEGHKTTLMLNAEQLQELLAALKSLNDELKYKDKNAITTTKYSSW